MVAAFPLDISVFLSSPYVLEVYPHRWSLLEGYLSHPGADPTDITLLGLQPPTISLCDYLFLLRRIHIRK